MFAANVVLRMVEVDLLIDRFYKCVFISKIIVRFKTRSIVTEDKYSNNNRKLVVKFVGRTLCNDRQNRKLCSRIFLRIE